MGDFYQRFERLCIEKGVSPSRAAMDIGLSNAAASGWADGSKPRKTTIRKLAEYFNVPYFYLSGEEEQKDPTSQKTGEVDDVTMELLDIINSVTHEERRDMLDMLRIMQKRRETR